MTGAGLSPKRRAGASHEDVHSCCGIMGSGPFPDKTRIRRLSLQRRVFRIQGVSENALFAYDEGLPGKAWASGHPVILTKFANSYFKRTNEAIEPGLTCGVALPVFAGEFLMAVMVLFCGDDEKHVGAIELWHNDAEK